MTKRSRSFLFSLATGVILATAGCGGGSSSATSPEAPDAGVAPRGGATIAGTVLSGSAAALPVGASSVKGLRVSVTGTSVQAVTDGAGRFTLQGVPAGRVELRFEGSGVDARLTLDGLQSGQTLTVTVRVTGSSASLIDDDDDDDDEGEVEFEGKVDSVGASSLVVAGRTVLVDASTRLVGHEDTPITLADFQPGDLVEVEGTAQADGSVLAKKVELEDDDEGDHDGDDDGDDDDDEVEFTGTISSLSPLTIAGRTVTTDGSTRYLGDDHKTLTPAEVLKVGNRVEVEGVAQPDGSVLAKKIELEEEDED